MIEQALKNRISDLAAGRVYPVIHPADPVLPLLVYQRVSSLSDHSHDGPALQTARFQVASWGADYADARRLADQVKTRLDGWRTPGIASLLTGEWDDQDELTQRWRVLTDFLVSYVHTESES